MSQTFPPQPVQRKDMLAPHRVVRAALACLIVLALGAVVTWEVLRVTAPPKLIIVSPVDNLLTTEHRITLEGEAAPGASVTVNGTLAAISMSGAFKENIDLRTGANVITINASKKFAKPNIIYRRVVVTAE
jgi:hypothetical protein